MTESRPTSAQRGYDAAWRKRRDAQLERQPWCELCQAAAEAAKIGDPPTLERRATTVDHRRARRTFPLHLQGSDEVGGSDHPSNLRSLCTHHHCTRREDKARGRK